MKLTTYLLPLLILFCCKQHKEDKELFYYPTGELMEEYEIKRGVKDGFARSFYKNGKIKAIGFYKNGIPDSCYVHYFENGNKEMEGCFNKLGVQTGEKKFYFESGALEQIEYLNKNGQVIDFRTFNKDGTRNFNKILVTFESVTDTINLGEYYEAAIRLANRKYNYSEVILGDSGDKNIFSKPRLPKKDSITCLLKIKPDYTGEYIIEGVITDVDFGEKIGEYMPVRDYQVIKFKKSIWVRPEGSI